MRISLFRVRSLLLKPQLLGKSQPPTWIEISTRKQKVVYRQSKQTQIGIGKQESRQTRRIVLRRAFH